ncbi:MAG: suppressor of fused domain protein [Exilibacterium sp.]
MTIIEHVERHLGVIQQGWKDDDSDVDFQIISFKDCPSETVSTFLSLGMSKKILKLNELKNVRQELVFSVYSMTISNMIVSCLMSLCEAILGQSKAVLRGEVIPLSTELAERIGFSAVYCTMPVFFDDDFCTYDESSPPTVMVWVLPIYKSEADYIAVNGWESFEDLLEEKDPDLCSLEREPVV